MDMPALELNPTALPTGTKVGAWRVAGTRGQGIYGTVYSAVSQEREPAGPVALKLAIYPGDPRFEREVELLSRIRHPSVPRLLDSGLWRAPGGRAHPFLVMEWADGVPLYQWAARCNPSSRQVLTLLAQAARALQASHEVSGIHRDVKGENVLVRPADGRLFLTDFGSGHFAGAKRLTPLPMLPGTPAYRSPQVWQCLQRAGLEAASPLLARPSDDVFALGVTAYRLVTDTYPPSTHPYDAESRCWQPGGGGPQPPRQLNPRVDAQLNALILGMLSVRPEERGTAGELAEALERGVAHGGASAQEPLFEWETEPPARWTEEDREEAEYLGHRPRHRYLGLVQRVEEADAAARAQRGAQGSGGAMALAQRQSARKWLPWLAAAMVLELWPVETGSVNTVERLPVTHGIPTEARRKKDAVSVGETAMSSSDSVAKSPSEKAITQEVPKNPLPGQRKPNAKGRCPGKQVAINGGCWAKVDFSVEECLGNFFVYRDECYAPAYEPARRPTSAPGQPDPY